MENPSIGAISDPCDDGDRNTKKVRFKEAVDGEETNMVVGSDQQSMMSFKDKLFGGGLTSPDRYLTRNECDLVLQDGDVNTSMVNGIPVALKRPMTEEVVASSDGVGEDNDGKGVDYEPWMLVKRKSRRGKRDSQASGGSTRLLGGEAQTSGPINFQRGGPSKERTGPDGPLLFNGLSLGGLNKPSLNRQNSSLDKQCLNGFSTNGLFEQEIVEVYSGSSENMENNLVLNNPMFEGPNESVVKLEASILDPKYYSVVSFNDNNATNAKSSMVNLNNSQVGHGAERMGGNAEGQTAGLGSTSA
ncbi:hypothetical protein PVK06_016458 [Gossypium arboreum]|uniref:Uncharacterized protein n=1 Tax=Gossypium arboreum TaxID=29729 RepID=A0ABR0Q0F9_GOSAR|nr:hypothetical protein PVK06_016458 [Gossypium arboreum]